MRSSKAVILFILFLFSYTVGHSQFKNEDELKKQAAKYFDDEDYANGFKLYSQLVSTYPKDPTYNFRLGVCMLYTDADKKKCISYLNVAAKTAKDNEKEALFYLGKAYHFNYRFDEAIAYYVQYKNIASASMIKKLQVDREVQACKNGKRLLANLEELVVLDKKQLNEGDYFRSYDLKPIGGKLLVKPDEFRTPTDKKKKDKSIIYLPKSNDQLYYASYGEKTDNKDIYIVRKLPSGEWSKPENLGLPVNTEFDEDYPFLHPNGAVLYFSSKGHNSMGGYDLFKSELDAGSGKWKEPVNLAFPINSPNDDILFVTDSLEKIAFFSSSRQSPVGKLDVYKILTEKRPAEFAFISGTVLKKDPNQSILSKIKVKNIETGEDAGTFAAKEDGTYSFKLPNGGKFIFTVETPGLPIQSEGVNIPMAYTYMPYKQAIGYDTQKLYITNFFDVKGDDENNYKEYLDLIAQKSKMDINANDFGINPDNPLAGNDKQVTNNNQVTKNTTEVATNNQITTNNIQSTDTETKENISQTNVKNNNQDVDTKKKDLSNKELIQMAYNDANELQQNADSLKENATTAFSAANSKQDQANSKKQEAEQTQSKTNIEADPAKKTELSNEAAKLNEEATLLSNQSTTANNIAKQLEVDATNKQKEADLNLQYAKALEEAEKTKNNTQALAKLEDLQKQLEEVSKQKSNSNALLENIKADAENKQKELASAQTKQNKLESDVKNITNEISKLDKQIDETKDKDLTDNLKAQKQEQESDLTDIKREQEANKNKITSLKEEAETLKSQADFASSIVSGGNTNEVATNNQTTNNSNNTAIVSNNNETKGTTQPNDVANEIKTNEASTNTNNASGIEVTTNNTPTNETKTNEAITNANNIGGNEVTTNNTSTNETKTNEPNANSNNIGTNEVAINNTNETKTNEQNANNIVANETGESANETQKQINNLNKQADSLSAAARQIRKDAKTLTGTEKQNAINKIGELEKQATDIRYTAAKQQIEADKTTYQSNEQKIQSLLQISENKENAVKVQQLMQEATSIAKASQELKEESEADPSIDSRIGGLSNADDKQKEALAKQQEALKLLKGNVTEVVASNVLNPTTNEGKNNESQTETTNNNVAVNQSNETQINNDNKLSHNSNNQQENKTTNANQQQNETIDTNNGITSNSVTPTNNEAQNNEVTNNHVVANEPGNNEQTTNETQNTNDNTNSAVNNTVTPTTNNEAKLSLQQVAEIKNSTQYKEYNTLQKEILKYTNQATKEQSQADLYKNRAIENVKRAEQLKTDAASLPDGTEKQDKLNQAEKLEQNGIVLKAKADSLQELAANTRSFAESKVQEADAYTQTLDQKTRDNIVAVSANQSTDKTNPKNKIITTTNQTNETVTQENKVTNNQTGTNQPNNETAPNINKGSTEAQKYIGTKGFEIKQGNAYNRTRPIPLNEKLPEGLVFRVQIGAFKNPIPTGQFKGLAPVGGETTPQGFIRYQAGMFDKYGNANAVKNDLKKLGYKDAFVVAYLNGKRINLADALAQLQQNGQQVTTDANSTAGITANNNIPVNNTQAANPVEETQALQSGNVAAVNGLFFTIQIGVYTNNVSNAQLRNLKPIYREKLDNGNYRYTAGIYSNLDLVKTDRRKVNAIGIPDAFVSAYLNGQRIKTADAIDKATNDKTIQFPSQQPIIFPEGGAQGNVVPQQPENNVAGNTPPANNNTGVQPFSNGVTEDPAPTADNGVKANDEGITFKVQIGAFRNQVPQQIADTWLKVKTWPIKYMQVNGLYLYTIGSFTEARFAQKLRGEAVGYGITDAFIVVFKDGKKLYGAESQKYLTR